MIGFLGSKEGWVEGVFDFLDFDFRLIGKFCVRKWRAKVHGGAHWVASEQYEAGLWPAIHFCGDEPQGVALGWYE